MALVSKTVQRVDIPHEPGEWMELKRLSWRQLEVAEEIQTDVVLKRMKSMGADMMKALRDAVNKGNTEQDPFKQYDIATVLEIGISKWSYDAEVNKESIDTLDAKTAEWVFREILSLNNPRTEEETKNA